MVESKFDLEKVGKRTRKYKLWLFAKYKVFLTENLPNSVNCVIILGQQQVNNLSEKEMFPMNKEAKNRPLVLKNLEVVGLTNYQRMALTQLELKNREKEHSEK